MPEAKQTLPTVTEGYQRAQVAAIEEEDPGLEAESDLLDDVDFSSMDDATIAALYEQLQQEEDDDDEEAADADFGPGQ